MVKIGLGSEVEFTTHFQPIGSHWTDDKVIQLFGPKSVLHKEFSQPTSNDAFSAKIDTFSQVDTAFLANF